MNLSVKIAARRPCTRCSASATLAPRAVIGVPAGPEAEGLVERLQRARARAGSAVTLAAAEQVDRLPLPTFRLVSDHPVVTSRSTDVRTWARKNGLTTAERGRLPRNVLEAYAAAHPASTAGSEDRTDTPTREGGRAAGPSAAGLPPDAAAPPATAGVNEQAAGGSTGKGRTARPYSRRSAPGRAEQPQVEDSVQQRLTAVEGQLAAAVARLEALEGRMTKSLLGLRITL